MLNLVMLALICSRFFLGRVLDDGGGGGVVVTKFGEEKAKLRERKVSVRGHIIS